IDQFLAFTGATAAEVLASTVRSHAEHPGVEILGEMLVAGEGATGYARVDYLTPTGLAPAWGDVRFTVVGTEGYLAVQQVPRTELVEDGERSETIQCTGQPSGWGGRYLDGALVTQEHVFTVTEICLLAQAQARRTH